LATAKKEYAQYLKDIEKFEATREARELKLKKQILKNITLDHIDLLFSNKYDPEAKTSYAYSISVNINNELTKTAFKIEDTPEFAEPRLTYTPAIIKDLEQMIEVLKACATATFNSKILGSVQNYL